MEHWEGSETEEGGGMRWREEREGEGVEYNIINCSLSHSQVVGAMGALTDVGELCSARARAE
jgi:hypothetical protein